MVIDAECLLRLGIVELDTENRRERGGPQYLLEAQLALEQQLVVEGGHRIAHRQPRDRSPQPVARENDVVGLVQPLVEQLPLFGNILGVHLHAAVAGGAEPLVAERAKAVFALDPHRQAIVPMLIGDHAVGRHVFVDPARCRDATERPAVDRQEAPAPQHRAHNHDSNQAVGQPRCVPRDRLTLPIPKGTSFPVGEETGSSTLRRCGVRGFQRFNAFVFGHDTLPRRARDLRRFPFESPLHQPEQQPGSHHRQQRVDREQVAHGLHELQALPQEHAADPNHRQDVHADHFALGPVRHGTQELPGRQRPPRPGRQSERQAHTPDHHVDKRKDERRSAGPLVPRRIVGISANELSDRSHVVSPRLREAEVQQAGPAECVRLRHPKDRNRHDAQQE